MADSAEAATADARRILLALACLLSAFFFNLVPPFLLKISVLMNYRSPIFIVICSALKILSALSTLILLVPFSQ